MSKESNAHDQSGVAELFEKINETVSQSSVKKQVIKSKSVQDFRCTISTRFDMKHVQNFSYLQSEKKTERIIGQVTPSGNILLAF